ncbi:MAG: hypothetical protein ACLGH0_01355, partial [Thermoanaerobaculia bacterium]
RMNELMASIHPRMRGEIDAANEEIARVLTPEQRAKFEKLKIRMRRHGPPGPGPGHPPPPPM